MNMRIATTSAVAQTSKVPTRVTLDLSVLSFVESILCGPVHSEKAVEMFKKTLEDVSASGGKTTVGGKVEPLPCSYSWNTQPDTSQT